MFEWIDNPRAAYVLAAYAVAACALIGLGVVSWLAYVRRARHAAALMNKDAAP